MIFDVVKTTHAFSKWADKATTRSLKFEVVPHDRYQLDIGDSYTVISRRYHSIKATDRQNILTSIFVTADDSYHENVGGAGPICGWAQFEKEYEDSLEPQPARLTIQVAVAPDVFDVMAALRIDMPGSATLQTRIEGLDYSWEPDGKHQTWNLSDETDTGNGKRRRVSSFRLNVDTFWTTEGAIQRAVDEQDNAWLADSPDPEHRKLAVQLQPEKSDAVISLLRQCRMLLVGLLVLAGLTFIMLAGAAQLAETIGIRTYDR